MLTVPNDYPDRLVGVVGLGYVGLTLAIAMADSGFQVTGVEIRKDVVEQLRRGVPHISEPGLTDRLAQLLRRGTLDVLPSIPENSRCRVHIITVGTPLGDDGRVRLDMIQNASQEVASVLRDGDMVVMRSTMKLGTTRKVVAPILDAVEVDYDLVFCPERTIEGRALIELFSLPQIVAGDSMRARVRAAQLFSFITPTVVQVGSLETAEMIKLVDNTQRDVHFAFANEVARLCDAAGVSAAEVITAGKLGYPRTNLPMPGLVGGPCLEKDTYILAEGMRELGIEPEISLASRLVNERQPSEIAAFLREKTKALNGFPNNPVITVAGLAFKGRPVTDDIRGSMAVPILRELRACFPDATFKGYDAVVTAETIRQEFGLEPVAELEDAFAGSNITVLTNNHPAFATMPIELLAERLERPGLIYDVWNNFDGRSLYLPSDTTYVALGSHRSS